ncbi:MAG: SRPBCC domain-containing protein [Deltaproteobacteria bacterium]|nr:SRPBCC domain-containing protein [Deltaproteobacteria bacterium]
MESIEVSGIIPAAPERVYDAWLNSQEHTSFTGGEKAEIDPEVGGKFTISSGYITGSNLELKKNRKIVQAWRTTEFPPGAPDSRLEVNLKRRDDGSTEIQFLHTDIPDGQSQRYQSGWIDFYLTPMRMYFGELANMERKNAEKRAVLEANKLEKEAALAKVVAAAPKKAPPKPEAKPAKKGEAPAPMKKAAAPAKKAPAPPVKKAAPPAKKAAAPAKKAAAPAKKAPAPAKKPAPPAKKAPAKVPPKKAAPPAKKAPAKVQAKKAAPKKAAKGRR